MMECLILLMYLEEPESWEVNELQAAIGDIITTVNEASDITGIHAGGLYCGTWGEDSVVSIFVQHDDRYDNRDEMVLNTFEKALEICDLEEDFWVMNRFERELLDAETD